MIAALYVEPRGVYSNQAGIDPWDEARDATKYRGPHPVVAHPPCQRWSRLAKLAHDRYGAPPPGADGGLFEASLRSLQTYGGVLEHPRGSKAFDKYAIRKPVFGEGWQPDTVLIYGPRNSLSVWVCEVHQSAYGHRAQKATWLVYVGRRKPFDLDWSSPPVTNTVENMGHKERRATPPRFRDVLVALAEWSR